MSRKIFSLDIRDTGISALLIENSLKGSRIEARMHVPYADIRHPSDTQDEDHTVPGPLAGALSIVAEAMDLSGAETIVSVPPKFISYRNFQVPFKDRKKIRQVLPFELEPVLPFAVDDLIIDFQIIHPAEKTDILVSVAQRDEIHSILAALRQFGLEPYMLTPGGLSTAACLAECREADPDFIFVDVDAEHATVFIVVSGQVHVARSFSARLSDPRSRAKKVADNIFQVIAAFESLFLRDFTLSRIFISGQSPDMETFSREIQDTLGIDALPVNMLDAVQTKLNFTDGAEFDPGLMNTAMGLATVEILGLRTINFLGEHSIVRRYWEEYKNDFIKTGLIAAFVFVLLMFNVLFEAHFLQKEVNQLNRRIAFIFQSTFPEIGKIIDPVAQMRTLVRQEQEKNVFSGKIDQEVMNIDILNEISSRIPAELDVELTNFVRGEDNLVISGHTDSFNNVDDMKSRLEQSEILKNITINAANLEKSTNRIQFKLKIDL